MRQYLLTHALGRWALRFREKKDLLHCAWFYPEMIGTLANDFLALKLVTRLCQPEAVFVDVGAHIGSVLARVHHHQPSARIIAIEAMPDKAARLVRYFPYAQVHACAVGARDGDVPFYVHPTQTAYSSVLAPVGAEASQTRVIRVPLRRLDDLVPHQQVDVVKIDVEGAELDALRGASGLLAACRPLLLLESALNARQPDHDNPLALHDFLSERDYVLVLPNRLAHDDPGLSRSSFAEGHHYPRHTTNYFAVPRERRRAVRDQTRVILNIRASA